MISRGCGSSISGVLRSARAGEAAPRRLPPHLAAGVRKIAHLRAAVIDHQVAACRR